jgi:hypothetical protein
VTRIGQIRQFLANTTNKPASFMKTQIEKIFNDKNTIYIILAQKIPESTVNKPKSAN